MKTETYTYVLPTYSVCYIANDDSSGLNDIEIQDIDRFIETLPNDLGIQEKEHYTIDYDNDNYFSHSNDIDSLAGDCIDVTITVFKVEK